MMYFLLGRFNTSRYVFLQVFIQLIRLLHTVVFLPLGLERAKAVERHWREKAKENKSNYLRGKLLLDHKFGGRQLLRDLFGQYQPKSDTVFILGSGESINDIDPDQWACIEKNDSIGFNFSVVHDHSPSLYFTEGTQSEPGYRNLIENLQARAADYRSIPLVILYEAWCYANNTISDLDSDLRKQVYWHMPYTIRNSTNEGVSALLDKWISKNTDPVLALNNIVAHGGSAGMIVAVSAMLGYKNIVLCGVDMINNTYFWEVNEQYADRGPVFNQSITLHATVDPKSVFRKHSIPMDDYLYLLDDKLLKPRGIKLYVSSARSKLSSQLALYPFKD